MTTQPAFPQPMSGTPAQPGSGIRVTANDFGAAYTTGFGGTSYQHPFKPALAGNQISFSRGLVESQFEPTIGGEKISTGALLRLEKKLVNAAGESWCCIEFVPTAEGFIDRKTKLEIVHTDQPLSSDPQLARCPVCMVLWQGGFPIGVHEILDFNVRYVREILATKQVRHHFP